MLTENLEHNKNVYNELWTLTDDSQVEIWKYHSLSLAVYDDMQEKYELNSNITF